jgi:putative IMPACT (imprinted ancient) family translation regulator
MGGGILFEMAQSGKRYPVPLEEIQREIIVVNSRFIAALAPVYSVEQAKAFMDFVLNDPEARSIMDKHGYK